MHYFQPRITARFTLLVILCVCRCCYVVIEQPRSSLMPLLTPMRWLQKALKNMGIKWFQHGLILFLMNDFCKVVDMLFDRSCEAPRSPWDCCSLQSTSRAKLDGYMGIKNSEAITELRNFVKISDMRSQQPRHMYILELL